MKLCGYLTNVKEKIITQAKTKRCMVLQEVSIHFVNLYLQCTNVNLSIQLHYLEVLI